MLKIKHKNNKEIIVKYGSRKCLPYYFLIR